MDPAGVLECYERALELTRAMHAAAQKGDWDALVQREAERAVLIDRLGREDTGRAGNVASRERKRELIATMLELDQQIQLLTQDWMHELREVLASISAEQRLSRTCGP